MRARALALLLLLLLGVGFLTLVQGARSCHEHRSGLAAAEERRYLDAVLHWRRSVQAAAPLFGCGPASAVLLQQLAEEAEAGGNPALATTAWQALSWGLEASRPAHARLSDLRLQAREETQRLHRIRAGHEPGPAVAPPDPRRRLRGALASLLFLLWLAVVGAMAWRAVEPEGGVDRRQLAGGLLVQGALLAGWLSLVRWL